MSENKCSVLKKLIEERAPWLKLTEGEYKIHGKDVCVVDFKDDEVNRRIDLPFVMLGSVALNKDGEVESSDIPMGVKLMGEPPTQPTNIIRFPSGCELESVHAYNHNSPNIHFHLKCRKLDDKGIRTLADAIVRITRRTREYAGLK